MINSLGGLSQSRSASHNSQNSFAVSIENQDLDKIGCETQNREENSKNKKKGEKREASEETRRKQEYAVQFKWDQDDKKALREARTRNCKFEKDEVVHRSRNQSDDGYR